MTTTRGQVLRLKRDSLLPDKTHTSVHQLRTEDGQQITGLLHTTDGANDVICLAHPRQDLTHHPIIGELLARGYAVWTQGTRSVNNDITLVHEQALLDIAAGQVFLRLAGFPRVITLGHSGGGSLFAFYHHQAALNPEDRISKTPAGRPTQLAVATMPVPDAAIFLAPHRGQGALLMKTIDPSVADEADPLSVIPELDPYRPENGFAVPPQPSKFRAEFVERYRRAQQDRIAHIDTQAHMILTDRNSAGAEQDPVASRRRAIAPRLLVVYRTDADLACVDPTIDPNDRPYGSLFGVRPDLTNYGLNGFARITTADAWLSTWSGLSTNADFARSAPYVHAPTLFIELTGDQACTPVEASAMFAALGATDKTHIRLRGTHFGASLTPGEPSGVSLSAQQIANWLAEKRF
ncbi:alpha/beta hydrolase [Mycobacteroides franklinii]|uniref:Alpha/beta hydrolase n=1 Tax=Mycobacteroides franklinii TaxID=948102 RepID=A0A1S1LIN2_9MYCO|nr:alpha/beta hydrolase [Mycobacteroides franklinii]OHU31115.1 alpha/beta hydrolase [Mycobacteroides franklinii]